MKTFREEVKDVIFSKRYFSSFILLLAFMMPPIPCSASSPDDICLIPDESTTVIIDGCDTGVANAKDAAGCTIWLRVMQCAGDAKKHSDFVRCVSKATDKLKKNGLITAKEKQKIQKCASKADYPCSDCEKVGPITKGPGFGFETANDSLSGALRTIFEAYVKPPGPDTDMLLLGRQTEEAIRYLQAHGEDAAAALVNEASKVDPLDGGRGLVIFHLMSRFESETGIQYLFDRAKANMPADCSSGKGNELTCSAFFTLRTAALSGLGKISSLGSTAARARVLELVGHEDASVQRQAIGVFYQTAGMSRWRAKRQMAERLPSSKRYLLHDIY